MSGLSPQQQAILWLALRNLRRFKLHAHQDTAAVPRGYLKCCLYLWEIMRTVYRVPMKKLKWNADRARSNWHYNRKNPGKMSFPPDDILQMFRCEVQRCNYGLYADKKRQHVAGASMSRSLAQMEKRGLLLRRTYIGIELTPMGVEIATTLEMPGLLANGRQRRIANYPLASSVRVETANPLAVPRQRDTANSGAAA